jgi:hypothetical protein
MNVRSWFRANAQRRLTMGPIECRAEDEHGHPAGK